MEEGEEQVEDRSGCGEEEELDGGGVGKMKEVGCSEGVVEEGEVIVGEEDRMAG